MITLLLSVTTTEILLPSDCNDELLKVALTKYFMVSGEVLAVGELDEVVLDDPLLGLAVPLDAVGKAVTSADGLTIGLAEELVLGFSPDVTEAETVGDELTTGFVVVIDGAQPQINIKEIKSFLFISYFLLIQLKYFELVLAYHLEELKLLVMCLKQD